MKVIDDEATPECSPHHSESLASTTTIPAMQVTPLQRTTSQESDKDNSLLSQSRTLPLGLANMEETEEKENKEPKPLGAPKKEHPSQEMELTLLLTPMTLFWRTLQPDLLLMTTTFLQTLCELHKAKQKARERKRRLQQLLLRRSGTPATPIVLVAVAPCCSAHSDTSIQRTFPRGQHSSSRVATVNRQEERDRGGVPDV